MRLFDDAETSTMDNVDLCRVYCGSMVAGENASRRFDRRVVHALFRRNTLRLYPDRFVRVQSIVARDTKVAFLVHAPASSFRARQHWACFRSFWSPRLKPGARSARSLLWRLES
jgi:hypothetical protein